MYLPVGIGGSALLLLKVPRLSELMGEGDRCFHQLDVLSRRLAMSFVLYFGSVLVGFIIVMTVPRLLNLVLKPDKLYRLYGFHYGIHRWIVRFSNAKVLSNIVGDSSWIVHYLRGIGYDLGKIVQTGANFGGNVKHENPFLSSVGSGTMVADALSMMNAEYSSTSFRLSRTSIGERNFLGNDIAYPPRGRTGDNCLLATKVMVPISGRVRENVGLLGSPAFRDPAVGRARQQLRPPEDRVTSSVAALPPRTGTTSSLSCGACSRGGSSSSCSPCSLGIAADFYASLGAAAIVSELLLVPLCSASPTGSWSTRS